MNSDQRALVWGRRRVLGAAAAGSACLLARSASAQPRTLRMILTAPPGSSIDVLGRLIADKLRERLGQTVVADNRPAAGGTVGTNEIARAAPDGQTFGLSFTGPLVTAPFLYAKLPYDPARDLAPVILVGSAPNLLAVHADLPVANFKEFVAYARARPGRLNYASIGNGSVAHLAMEMLKERAGLFVVHIPFNGAPAAVQATAAGDVQAVMSNPTSLLPMVAAKRVRVLATTGLVRWPGLPDVPTVAESGFPGFEAIAWNGFVAPAGTPGQFLDRWNREIDAILRSADIRPRIEAAGWEPVGGSAQSFAAFMSAERQRWEPVIKRSGAKLD